MTGYQPQQRRVDIDWHCGSRLAMLLDTGNHIEVIAEPDDVHTGHPEEAPR